MTDEELQIIARAQEIIAKDLAPAAFRAAQDAVAAEGGYAPGLAALRHAEVKEPSEAERFEEQYRAQRSTEFGEQARRRDERFAENPPVPRLTVAEAAEYKSPDPYAEGLRLLREKESRR